MYFRILKKDLKRKKTMNAILLIFIILAATFIASSVNNMVSVFTALDIYFDKAEVPDYWICFKNPEDLKQFQSFAKDRSLEYRQQEIFQIDPKEIYIDGTKFDYSNTTTLSTLENTTNIFDENDQRITEIKKGEIYLSSDLFYSSEHHFKKGDSIEITVGSRTKTFTLAGAAKDAILGSSMSGITRFLISREDYEYLRAEAVSCIYSLLIYSDDSRFMDSFNELSLNTITNIKRSEVKAMYIMDLIMAGVLLIVSVCLILISMVILRFTINFTMSEEFREIGVMKAIGLKNSSIRGLYITKYLAISTVGCIIGLALSRPFSELMISNLSRKIMVSGSRYFSLNILCAFSVAAIVVLFCYFCTRKIRTFSPIDAIRNGEKGQRYRRKNFLSLNRSVLPPVPFMAVNDILSSFRRFASMILIFTIGLLLIIIPVNTINTVQSDQLITCFSMAECDHVLSEEQLFNSGSNNRKDVEENLAYIKNTLSENNIDADVFQEIMFRMNITYHGKKKSSLAFQGIGDSSTDMYAYLKGTPPQRRNEVGISYVVADYIGASIGDTVEIKDGEQTKEYLVTAIFQTMNNFGEGIRFHPDERLDYIYAAGSFGIQLLYRDHPDSAQLKERKILLQKLFPDSKVFTAGEYVNYMIGDVAGQIQSIKYLILAVVLCINILVTVLMVKSFLTKEKGEIAILKAMGFKNTSLILWQTLRIGIVLFLSVIIGTLLSTPLSKLSSGQIFHIMGAYSIEFDIVPLEVYVIYPLLVLSVTIFAGMLAALQLRKIPASETANAE